MKKVEFKYGVETVTAEFNERNLMGLLEGCFSRELTPDEEKAELLRSIRMPISSDILANIVHPGKKVVIMASDITRPSPSWKILPVLVGELNRAGVRDEDITILFGMGVHRAHTIEEQRKLVGDDIFSRIECCDSVNGEPYIYVGDSELGTPYYVHKRVVEADTLICTGNIEYHWFAGYSGGAKAVLPGACNHETIRRSHSRIGQPGTEAGNLLGPVRRDIDGILKYIKIHFIVNVVLDDKKRILRAFSGDPIKAHCAGCEYLDSIYGKKISEPADVVVASCGGYPKDINVYQAQKALDNASLAVKKGGVIILIGNCSEGFENRVFEEWMRDADTPESILERIQQDFQMGGHKAASFAKVLTKAKVVLVTEMKKEDVETMFIEHSPISQLQNVINKYTAKAGSVLVIPQCGSILPIIDN